MILTQLSFIGSKPGQTRPETRRAATVRKRSATSRITGTAGGWALPYQQCSPYPTKFSTLLWAALPPDVPQFLAEVSSCAGDCLWREASNSTIPPGRSAGASPARGGALASPAARPRGPRWSMVVTERADQEQDPGEEIGHSTHSDHLVGLRTPERRWSGISADPPLHHAGTVPDPV